MRIEIIPHNSPDYNLLVKLRQEILRVPLKLTFTPKELASEYNQIHIALKNNGTVIGGMALVPEQNKLKMRQVCIASSYQKKGLGKKLLQFGDNYALNNNYTAIYCHARKSVVSFYLHFGYKITTNEFTEVGIPHFKMEKQLNIRF